MSAKQYVNIHGRKGGRGIRPFVLIPKVVALAVFVGSYGSATMLWLHFRSADPAETQWALQAVSYVFRSVVVPSLLATLLFGVLLFLQHPKVFIQRRWMQAKLVVAATLPVLHLLARKTFIRIKDAYLHEIPPADPEELEALARRFTVLLLSGLFAAGALVFLGRHKPRLGQTPRASSAAVEEWCTPTPQADTHRRTPPADDRAAVPR